MDLIKDARAKKDSKEGAKAAPPPSIKTFAVTLWKCFVLIFCMLFARKCRKKIFNNEMMVGSTCHVFFFVLVCEGICMIEVE